MARILMCVLSFQEKALPSMESLFLRIEQIVMKLGISTYTLHSTLLFFAITRIHSKHDGGIVERLLSLLIKSHQTLPSSSSRMENPLLACSWHEAIIELTGDLDLDLKLKPHNNDDNINDNDNDNHNDNDNDNNHNDNHNDATTTINSKNVACVRKQID